MAERKGFEPLVPGEEYNTLAGCRFRPLSHLSTQISMTKKKLNVYLKIIDNE